VRDAFQVTRDNNTITEFQPSEEGLYYYDFEESVHRKQEHKQEMIPVERTMVVQTVEDIKRNFTKREIEAEEKVGKLYVILGCPARSVFKDKDG
jgi:hypothetical protein